VKRVESTRARGASGRVGGEGSTPDDEGTRGWIGIFVLYSVSLASCRWPANGWQTYAWTGSGQGSGP
jgi:hypothetical protein